MIWFTGDTHFGHANVIKYTSRPHENVEQMDRALIVNWNSRVRPEDEIYHVGDVGLCSEKHLASVLRQLNGKKHLVYGNHDKMIRKTPELQEFFVWCKDYAEVNVEKQRIILSHYAMRVWNKSHGGSWMLYGHSHGSLPEEKHMLSTDVGIDAVEGFCPISFKEVAARMAKREWVPVDHHKERR